jgi:hypothetical protein
LNTTQKVLFESRKENGYIEGYTTNYIRVKVNTNLVRENNIYEVLLKNPSHSLMLSLMKGVEPLDAEIINT